MFGLRVEECSINNLAVLASQERDGFHREGVGQLGWDNACRWDSCESLFLDLDGNYKWVLLRTGWKATKIVQF